VDLARWRNPTGRGAIISCRYSKLGERAYEVYLTAYVRGVWGVMDWFVRAGKPLWGVPVLFIGVIAAAIVWG